MGILCINVNSIRLELVCSIFHLMHIHAFQIIARSSKNLLKTRSHPQRECTEQSCNTCLHSTPFPKTSIIANGRFTNMLFFKHTLVDSASLSQVVIMDLNKRKCIPHHFIELLKAEGNFHLETRH